ncbi:DICT sensory domain-containing protein [Conexibacter sp. DBS9H8]|uniref:DICT sensory domain-containing protein n=1 Tax=Conexibacter sp. DBS9H8 TaxID=2937801 RepID=UPI00200E85F8|nr:DICT sensory domain-containing protein [Conexibacter sp. DBS9H8]
MSDGLYSSSALAEITGIPVGTLRVWESRHGFPAAVSPPGQRKRYDEQAVAQVRAVIALRARGLSLAAAIAEARGEAGAPPPPSIFAALRRARPDLPVRVFHKPALIALSRAIEDEHAARASGGVLIGAFQHERHYRGSERRWRALAQTAALAVVLADFPTDPGATRAPAGAGTGPWEVSLGPGHPLEREWTVLLHAPGGGAVLAAWEIPELRPGPEPARRFELIWSCDPAAVQTALVAAANIIGPLAPDLRRRLDPHLRAGPPGLSGPGFGDELSTRAFAYLTGAR